MSVKPSRFNALIADVADIEGNNNAKAMRVRILMVSLPPNAPDHETRAQHGVSMNPDVM